jgi:hypothetical protein
VVSILWPSLRDRHPESARIASASSVALVPWPAARERDTPDHQAERGQQDERQERGAPHGVRLVAARGARGGRLFGRRSLGVRRGTFGRRSGGGERTSARFRWQAVDRRCEDLSVVRWERCADWPTRRARSGSAATSAARRRMPRHAARPAPSSRMPPPPACAAACSVGTRL